MWILHLSHVQLFLLFIICNFFFFFFLFCCIFAHHLFAFANATPRSKAKRQSDTETGSIDRSNMLIAITYSERFEVKEEVEEMKSMCAGCAGEMLCSGWRIMRLAMVEMKCKWIDFNLK